MNYLHGIGINWLDTLISQNDQILDQLKPKTKNLQRKHWGNILPETFSQVDKEVGEWISFIEILIDKWLDFTRRLSISLVLMQRSTDMEIFS